MKVQKIIFALFLVSFTFLSCKTETKQEIEQEAKQETIALKVSGMHCEMSCASTIQSKLAKKKGVIDAKIVFNDSIATIQYDANKTNKKELIAVVEGIGDGLYKASETVGKKGCATECKKEDCDGKQDKKACVEDCEKECSKTEKV